MKTVGDTNIEAEGREGYTRSQGLTGRGSLSGHGIPLRRYVVLATLAMLITASVGGTALAQQAGSQWHISLSFDQPTFVVGQPISLAGSLSPPQQATILLTIILPDASVNIFYVDTDASGNFNFSHEWGGLRYYGAYGTVYPPSTDANVTTDVAHCYLTYAQTTPGNTTSTTSQVTTTTQTVTTTSSSQQGGSGPSPATREVAAYNSLYAGIAIAACAVVLGSVVAIKHRRSVRQAPPLPKSDRTDFP